MATVPRLLVITSLAQVVPLVLYLAFDPKYVKYLLLANLTSSDVPRLLDSLVQVKPSLLVQVY